MMIWTKLLQPLVSINCRLLDSNDTVAPKQACEHCGLGKNFLRSIPESSFANNIPLSSMVYTCLYNVLQIYLSFHLAESFFPH